MFTRVAVALFVGLAVVGWLSAAVVAAEAAEPPGASGHPEAAEPSAPSEPPEASGHAGTAEYPEISEETGTPAHDQAPAHGQGEVNLNPLDFKSDLAIWTAAVFLLLLLILWKFAWRPIAAGLQKREQRIAEEIASAERRHTEARGLLEDYQQRLAASGEEIQQMLEAARRDAEQVGQQIVEKAKAGAEAEKQRALGEIERATADALKELAEQSAALAVQLAGKIVRSQLDPKAHAHLIQQAVADFSKQQPGKN